MLIEDPEYVYALMDKLIESEGWQRLWADMSLYRDAIIRRVLEPDCSESETDYYRGVVFVLGLIIEHPTKVIKECRDVIDRTDKMANGPQKPRRRNVPRGL